MSRTMSASIRPISPPQPSSASVTATTVSSSSPPTTSRSTVFPSGSSRGGGGPSTTAPSSASSFHPPPPNPVPAPGVAPGTQAQEAQTHAHPPHHHHHPQSHTLHPAQNRPPSGPPPSSSSAARAPASPTNPSHLPTEAEQEQIAQARTALVASIGNTLDHELQTRASLLHSNQAAIEKQERDVERALADLRREDDKLLKVLNQGSRQVKELGDVQNWAERLERDFLVLEETMRLVHEGGSGSESGSWTGSESGSWSGSERGSVVGDGDEDGDVRMEDGDGDGDPVHEQVVEHAVGKGKGKQPDGPSSTSAMDVDSAQDSLPHRTAGAEPSTLVDLVSSSNGATAPPQQSPTWTGWLRRFWWRS
ncbi:hypothetical protein FJTKL_05499 [Diaporthe vaccinii]|uniref:Biogenesis of lysosome-related organelles complex 1 subunit 1 n=1 Tax=Diaporthe vaccinii TaxID=105482 RepID=A0ABR4FG33_9PEZI